jgi:hypothetical protein
MGEPTIHLEKVYSNVIHLSTTVLSGSMALSQEPAAFKIEKKTLLETDISMKNVPRSIKSVTWR